MLDATLASPSTPSPASSESGVSHSVDPPGDASSFLVLTLKEDEGACIATVLYAGLASVLRLVLDRHDEWVLGTASDEWPVEEGGDEHWDCLSLVGEFMAGTQAERRQLNARLSGEYLAARAA